MKKVDVLSAYAVINTAKLTKLEDEAKFKVIKACKAMKPIVDELKSFEEDAKKKLQGEEHAQMEEKAEQWGKEGEKTTLTIEERIALNNYFESYKNRVNKCLQDELEKEVELTYDKLTEEEVKKLVTSNDWNVAQVMAVMEAL